MHSKNSKIQVATTFQAFWGADNRLDGSLIQIKPSEVLKTKGSRLREKRTSRVTVQIGKPKNSKKYCLFERHIRAAEP